MHVWMGVNSYRNLAKRPLSEMTCSSGDGVKGPHSFASSS